MLQVNQPSPLDESGMPRLCVVAPVYNEAECLGEFQRRLFDQHDVPDRQGGEHPRVQTQLGNGRDAGHFGPLARSEKRCVHDCT